VKRPVQLIWTRENDMRGAYYRPLIALQLRGAVAEDGKPVALQAHVLGQSIIECFRDMVRAGLPGPLGTRRTLTHSAIALFSSGSVADPTCIEGVSNSVYALDNMKVDYTYVKTGLPIATWRSVGHSVNAFAMESFVDELAHASKQDPVEIRRRILPEKSRARRVLDAVAKLSKWGEPLPPGVARGLARHEAFETEVAEVAEVEMVDNRIKVRRVYCVVDCGMVVNPDIVRAQMEGGILFGLSAALDQEVTLVDGVVQQQNFDTFPSLRMFEAPEIVVQILENEEKPTGVGEPGLPPIAPAVANAIFTLTGKRLRRMPLQRAWNEVAT
jgi:CO/xanthine dehydrogenase Mo-binding subunit